MASIPVATIPIPTPPITINTTTPAVTEIGTPPPVKPGWQTSEFWERIAAIALTVIFASGALTGHDVALAIAGMAATVLGSLGYTVSRTMVKVGSSQGTAVTSQTAAITQTRSVGTLVPMLALIVLATSGCAASQRADALTVATVGANAAANAYVAYDKTEQAKIATDAATASAKATTLADGTAALATGKAALAAYIAKRAPVDKALVATYNAIAIASTLSDDPSLAGAQKALAQLVSAVVALTGGAP